MVKSYRFKLIILAVNIKTGKMDDDSNVFPWFTYHGFVDGDVEETTNTVVKQLWCVQISKIAVSGFTPL